MTKEEAYKKVIWDYTLDNATFWEIFEGKKTLGWFNRDWALVRLIENLNYYDLIEVVPFELIVRRWDAIKSKIRRGDVKRGFEFAIRKRTLSTSE